MATSPLDILCQVAAAEPSESLQQQQNGTTTTKLDNDNKQSTPKRSSPSSSSSPLPLPMETDNNSSQTPPISTSLPRHPPIPVPHTLRPLQQLPPPHPPIPIPIPVPMLNGMNDKSNDASPTSAAVTVHRLSSSAPNSQFYCGPNTNSSNANTTLHLPPPPQINTSSASGHHHHPHHHLTTLHPPSQSQPQPQYQNHSPADPMVFNTISPTTPTTTASHDTLMRSYDSTAVQANANTNTSGNHNGISKEEEQQQQDTNGILGPHFPPHRPLFNPLPASQQQQQQKPNIDNNSLVHTLQQQQQQNEMMNDVIMANNNNHQINSPQHHDTNSHYSPLAHSPSHQIQHSHHPLSVPPLHHHHTNPHTLTHQHHPNQFAQQQHSTLPPPHPNHSLIHTLPHSHSFNGAPSSWSPTSIAPISPLAANNNGNMSNDVNNSHILTKPTEGGDMMDSANNNGWTTTSRPTMTNTPPGHSPSPNINIPNPPSRLTVDRLVGPSDARSAPSHISSFSSIINNSNTTNPQQHHQQQHHQPQQHYHAHAIGTNVSINSGLPPTMPIPTPRSSISRYRHSQNTASSNLHAFAHSHSPNSPPTSNHASNPATGHPLPLHMHHGHMMMSFAPSSAPSGTASPLKTMAIGNNSNNGNGSGGNNTTNGSPSMNGLNGHLTQSPSGSGSHINNTNGTTKPVKTSGRRDSYTRFTAEEEAMLLEGVRVFGVGNWKKILNSYQFHWKRTAVDLKDKYRNMTRAKLRKMNAANNNNNNNNNNNSSINGDIMNPKHDSPLSRSLTSAAALNSNGHGNGNSNGSMTVENGVDQHNSIVNGVIRGASN